MKNSPSIVRGIRKLCFDPVLLISIVCLADNSVLGVTLADLVPQNISASPIPATAGGSVNINYTVANTGGTAAPGSHTRVQIKNAANVTLIDQSFTTLAIGANSSVNESRSMSLVGAIAGTYYAYVIVDSQSQVTQSNTANDGQNNAGIAFTVQLPPTLSDLVPQSISVNPNPATAGGSVTVSYTVANTGGTPAPGSHTRVQ